MHSTVTQIAQRGECNFRVVEGDGAVGENLFLFVALAGEQDDVVWLCGAEARANGGGAVGLDGVEDVRWL